MKIVIAPDSFKNCLRADFVAKYIAQGYSSVRGGDSIEIIPLADGGEGSCDIIRHFTAAEKKSFQVHDPLMRKIRANAIIWGGDCAAFEMASASGIELLDRKELNPLLTTTFGAGEILKKLIDKKFRKILICIGGSATNDCGAGFLQALGVKYFDKEGKLLANGIGGGMLKKICKIDFSALSKLPADLQLTVACDVTNPLCGKKGASYTFAPQKGADREMVIELDRNLKYFRQLCIRCNAAQDSSLPGDGAAGGLGFALQQLLKAELRSGADYIINLAKLPESLKDADLLITGEGRTDSQSFDGKLCAVAAGYARKNNVKTILLSGSLGGSYDKMYEVFDVVSSLSHGAIGLEEALLSAKRNLIRAGKNIGEIINISEKKNI
jgi:glycerate kinase